MNELNDFSEKKDSILFNINPEENIIDSNNIFLDEFSDSVKTSVRILNSPL